MVRRLAMETEMLVISTHAVPADLESLLRTLAKDGAFDNERVSANHPGVESGVDSWGQKLVFIARDKGIITLRSKGPDRIDNGGRGDDIETTIDCRKYIQTKTTGAERQGDCAMMGAEKGRGKGDITDYDGCRKKQLLTWAATAPTPTPTTSKAT
jgi:hypothetical protein